MTMAIKTKTDLKEAILDQLKRGKANAIPGRLLAERLGYKNDRQIRLALRELIAEGKPIASALLLTLSCYSFLKGIKWVYERILRVVFHLSTLGMVYRVSHNWGACFA